MSWQVLFHGEFLPEFKELPEVAQDELLARLKVLGQNMLNPANYESDSKFSNMKELRFQLDGIWRFAFAFDPHRSAIILCGGDKETESSKKFYNRLIEIADRRFEAHIASLQKVAKGTKS